MRLYADTTFGRTAPAALARLGHPDGEMNLTRGAAERGALQAISSNASCSLDELFGAQEQAVKDGLKKTTLWYQLYVHRDRPKSERVIRKAVEYVSYIRIRLQLMRIQGRV